MREIDRITIEKKGLYPEKTSVLYLGNIGIPKSVYYRLHLDYHSPFGTNYFIKIKLNQN